MQKSKLDMKLYLQPLLQPLLKIERVSHSVSLQRQTPTIRLIQERKTCIIIIHHHVGL